MASWCCLDCYFWFAVCRFCERAKPHPGFRPSSGYIATGARNEPGDEGVEFIHEDDGSITARDIETGLARGGKSKAEALSQLAEVLELHEGCGEPIENPDEFLREEFDIEPDEIDGDQELPEFLR